MRDYRLPIVVSVPAALAFLGLIWYLRSKKDDSKSTKSPKQQKAAEAKTQDHSTRKVEREGITITQRKIPDKDGSTAPAGDRGDDKCFSLKTSGIEIKKPKEDVIKSAGDTNGSISSPKIISETSVASTAISDQPSDVVEEVMEAASASALHVSVTPSDESNITPDVVEEVKEVTSSSALHFSITPSDESSTTPDVVEEVMEVASASALHVSITPDESNTTPDVVEEIAMEPASQIVDTSSQIVDTSSQIVDTSSQEDAFVTPVESQTELATQNAEDIEDSIVVSKANGDLQSLPPTEQQETVTISATNGESGVASCEVSNITAELSNEECVVPSTVSTVCAEFQSQSNVAEPNNKSDLSQHLDILVGPDIEIDSSTAWSSLSPAPPSPPPSPQCEAEPETPSSNTTDSTPKQEVSVDSVVQDVTPTSSPSLEDNLAESDSSMQTCEDAASKEVSPTKSTSPGCDSQSEGSNDSGRGQSDQESPSTTDQPSDKSSVVQFDFNMPSELCGRFIGRQGKNINTLKQKTGANISLTYNPFTPEFQICQVIGKQSEVDTALAMIRRKFPLSENPHLTMAPVNLTPATSPSDNPIVIPDVMQLSLPEGVSVEVYVSAVVDAGHVFIQQPTHRSFMSLEKLHYFLNTAYSQDPNIPSLPLPLECGVICVCLNEGAWYRAMITSQEDEAGECQIKFVDYGGYAQMPVASLKQIRTDFMSLPFQAVECYLGNITHLQSEQYYSDAATNALYEMTAGKLLQCQVVARTENGLPHIHLYQIDADNNNAVMINRALVNSQLVRWVEIR